MSNAGCITIYCPISEFTGHPPRIHHGRPSLSLPFVSACPRRLLGAYSEAFPIDDTSDGIPRLILESRAFSLRDVSNGSLSRNEALRRGGQLDEVID